MKKVLYIITYQQYRKIENFRFRALLPLHSSGNGPGRPASVAAEGNRSIALRMAGPEEIKLPAQGLRLYKNGNGELGGGLHSRRQPRQRQHGNVVVLAKVHGGLRGLCRAGIGGKERIEPAEAEQLAMRVAGLEQSVRIKREVVAFTQLEVLLLISSVWQNPQRQRAGQADLALVEIRRRMPRAGHQAAAV